MITEFQCRILSAFRGGAPSSNYHYLVSLAERMGILPRIRPLGLSCLRRDQQRARRLMPHMRKLERRGLVVVDRNRSPFTYRWWLTPLGEAERTLHIFNHAKSVDEAARALTLVYFGDPARGNIRPGDVARYVDGARRSLGLAPRTPIPIPNEPCELVCVLVRDDTSLETCVGGPWEHTYEWYSLNLWAEYAWAVVEPITPHNDLRPGGEMGRAAELCYRQTDSARVEVWRCTDTNYVGVAAPLTMP